LLKISPFVQNLSKLIRFPHPVLITPVKLLRHAQSLLFGVNFGINQFHEDLSGDKGESVMEGYAKEKPASGQLAGGRVFRTIQFLSSRRTLHFNSAKDKYESCQIHSSSIELPSPGM
jgi:hypothetical protein